MYYTVIYTVDYTVKLYHIFNFTVVFIHVTLTILIGSCIIHNNNKIHYLFLNFNNRITLTLKLGDSYNYNFILLC